MPTQQPGSAGSSREAQSTVHRIGDAEITQTAQDGITVYAVRGAHSRELLEHMERVVKRNRGEVGLDVRGYGGRAHNLLPTLRRLNRHYKSQGRVFLLYEPPSSLMDMLQLEGSAEEFNIFSADQGLQTKKDSNREKSDVEDQHQPERTSRKIVSFTRDLERADQLESSMETAGRRSLLMAHAIPPRFTPFELTTAYFPHDKLGGDFLHVQLLDDEHLGVSIGDVSGHGLEAALIMGMTKKVMELRARDGSREDPGQVMIQVNEDVFPDLDHYTFVTALYGVLQRSTGTFTYSRAGHNYPLIISPARGEMFVLNSPGMALGMDRGELFRKTMRHASANLIPGDLLLLYTDGLTEAANPRRGQFGMERLAQFFRETAIDRPVEEIKDRLLAQVNDFLEGSTLQDDLTVILIRHEG